MNETLMKKSRRCISDKGNSKCKANQSPAFFGSPLGLGNLICNIGDLEEGLREARTFEQRKCD